MKRVERGVRSVVKAIMMAVLGALGCSPKPANTEAPSITPAMPVTASSDAASTGGVSYGNATRAAAKADGSFGGRTYGNALPQGAPMTWTVRVIDNATSAPLPRISVTAFEQTWGCKTRELPEPPRNVDDRHRPPRIETYDCNGGRQHITKLTDASGSVTLQLPHSLYQLAPIKHPAYFPTDFPDPSFRRISSSLVKTTIANAGATRLVEYRLFPYSALKVKTETQAATLALQHPIVKKCLAQHSQLTHTIEKPSLMWRVEFLYSGAKNLEFSTTVDSISGEVGFLGCWDPCCAMRAPSRFERRLDECAKLRSATTAERKRWDCDTLAQDFVKLQELLRRQNDTASLQKYEQLYRAYEASAK
jgi:hypothetical protein